MGHAWEERDEAVVAASVDEVWAAIATGPGIDSWFMGRNQVDPGPAGSVTTDLGGFVSTGTVTAWDPPNHFAYRSDGPGERFIAFEYLIEGRDRSSAVLRLVASGFLPDDDWEAEFEAMTAGGEMYFQTLVAYLDHFARRFATPVNVTGPPVADWPAAWAALRAGLGLGDQPAVGDLVRLDHGPHERHPEVRCIDDAREGRLGELHSRQRRHQGGAAQAEAGQATRRDRQRHPRPGGCCRKGWSTSCTCSSTPWRWAPASASSNPARRSSSD